jgi:biopolymer transport protein ExbD
MTRSRDGGQGAGGGRGWTRRVTSKGVTPDINVTPLVDVVLVLLIIFMVVAPRMDQDVPVELPGIFNPDPEVKTMDPVKLSVARAGEYYVEEQKYDLDGAIAALSDLHATDPMRRLVLRADSRLGYKDVRDILARAQQVGFPGMSLMVGERHKSGEATAAGGGDTQGTADDGAHTAAATSAGDDGAARAAAGREG